MTHVNPKTSNIVVKRAYESATPEDGYRVLVDRLWPRGLSRTALELDQWERDLAPGTELRKWFGHDPKRWNVFQQRYRSELASEDMQERMRHLLAQANGRTITLVYG